MRHSRMGFGFNPSPAREQNLLISKSKHLYLTKAGLLRYQQKAIDPRLAGTKTLLERLVLLDVDTGVVYCEMHPADEATDILGFLARAWSVKPDHPMRGFPQQLNVPKAAIADPAIAPDLRTLASWGAFELAALPAGFAAGIHAVKKFENEMMYLTYRSDQIGIYTVNKLSALISCQVSTAMAHFSKEAWASVLAPDASFTQMIDEQYDPPAGWRLDEFAAVLNGIKAED